MSFNVALTSGKLESLRGTSVIAPSHSARAYLSALPNTVVYSANVNQVTFAQSFASVNYDTGVGTLADVRVGMTILISHTSAIKDAFWVGRIRLAPTGAVFYINETSAAIEDDDFVFVIDDYRIWDKLPVYSSGTIKMDYDITFRQLLPRISNLLSGYASFITGASETYSFSPTVTATTDGATISSYLWDVGDGTITVGSATTREITVTFPPGFRWVHFSSTDSGGRTTTRHFPVWVHDADNMPSPLTIGDIEVSATVDDGFSGSVPAFSGISDLLDNTLVCAWLDAERYNGTLTHIVNNVALLGRLRNTRATTAFDDTGQIDASVRYEVEGPLQTLGRLEVTPVEILSDSTPTAFCQIDTCTPWREMFFILSEMSTFHELHSISFDNADSTYADLGVTTPSGSILNAIRSIAECLNAQPQMNSAGEFEVVRNAVMIPDGSRAALVTVADWGTSDLLGIDGLDHDNVNVVGRILGSGGSFNTTNSKIVAVDALAPGMAQDYPDGTASLDRQVLAANQNKLSASTELNIRIGHALAKAQDTDELSVVHPDGYWWLTPSVNQWFTWTLDGSETANEIVLDNTVRWQLASVNAVFSIDSGAVDVRAVYRRETSGAPGQLIVYPPQTITPITVPEYPPLPPFPAFDIGEFFLPDDVFDDIVPAPLAGTLSAIPKRDGNTVLAGTELGAWIASDFLPRLTPTWIEVTPPLAAGETIVDGFFTNDTNPPGALLLTNGVGETTDYDFTLNNGGFASDSDPDSVPSNLGVYSAGTGWRTQPAVQGTGPGARNVSTVDIRIHFPSPVAITAATMTYNMTKGTFDAGSIFNRVLLRFGGSDVVSAAVDSSVDSNGTGKTLSITPGFYMVDEVYLQLRSRFQFVSGGAGSNGLGVITDLELTGGDSSHVWYTSNVFDTALDWAFGEFVNASCSLMRIGESYADVYLFDPANNDAYYSADYGETFAAAVNVGTAPAGPAGFDTQRTGLVTLGGAAAKVRIATTAGGAYADNTIYPTNAIPTAIYIPRYKFAGTNNGVGESDPDYLTGSSIADTAAGHSLWKVTTGGGSVTQIDAVSGSLGLTIGPNCLHKPWYSTAYQDIMAILSFSGTRKLAVSLNNGTSWVFSGALNANADYPVTRRTDTLRRQLFAVNGPNAIYTSDYKTNPLILATRIGPSVDNLNFLKVLF